MSYDYNNGEVVYIKERDPRELNVVERIKNEAKAKSALPNINDDHVCNTVLETKLASVEKELADLKNANLVRELLSALSEGGDIILPASMNMETAAVIDKDVALDLNGKRLTIAEDTVGDGVFHVTGGTMTISGDGYINGAGKNEYNMAIWADGGNVIINGGTFTNEGATATDDPSHMDLIYIKNGSNLEINGGFFRCATPKWTLNKHDKTESTITVKGGTFVDYNPAASETEPGGTVSFVAEGYTVISETQDNGETWYTVVAE